MEEEGVEKDLCELKCSAKDSRSNLSQFGASNSGEPLAAQLLVVDFTPLETDTAYVKNKCTQFWEYISSRKDLRHLKVKPGVANVVQEPSVAPDLPSLSCRASFSSKAQSLALERKQSTAVSMLEFVEGKGLINRVFEAKLKQPYCSLGPRAYPEADSIALPAQKKDTSITSGTCSTSQTSRLNALKTQVSSKKIKSQCAPHARQDSNQGGHLCRTLQEWDDKHPKSMEPPGHPPFLTYPPVVQRTIMM